MRQHVAPTVNEVFRLNVDTLKPFRFDIKDFELSDLLIEETSKRNLYFDEIQVVEGWKLYDKTETGSRIARSYMFL